MCNAWRQLRRLLPNAHRFLARRIGDMHARNNIGENIPKCLAEWPEIMD